MIVDHVREKMQFVEEITHRLGDNLNEDDYYIEDMGCPHIQPKLPDGYSAVYLFVYEYKDGSYELLKIGKVNSKSKARFTSQHYGLSAPSTLAKSICEDQEFKAMGIDKDCVKGWMIGNLRRINVYIKTDCGKAMTELVEAVLHYAFRPRYEGDI